MRFSSLLLFSAIVVCALSALVNSEVEGIPEGKSGMLAEITLCPHPTVLVVQFVANVYRVELGQLSSTQGDLVHLITG